MTFWQYVLAHALGGLIEAAVLIAVFKWHKPHIGKETIDL